MESLGWEVIDGMFVKKILGIKWAKWQRPEIVNKPKVGVFMIKVEPEALKGDKKVEKKLIQIGFRKDKSPMLPTKTVWLDLRKSEKKLLEEMHYKTRYNIKKYSQKADILRGDKVSDEQLQNFFGIYKQNAQRQKFWGLKSSDFKKLFECFKDNGYLIKTNEGGLVVLIHDNVAYYSHNAVTNKGRQEFLPTILTWKAIKLAKKLGCRRFDFEGIEDSRYPVTKKWAGFTRFKKSFGGEVIEYLGSFTKLNWRKLW